MVIIRENFFCLHLFLGANHGLYILLLYEASQSLNKYFGWREILETLKAQITLNHGRMVLHLIYSYKRCVIVIEKN